MGSGTSPIDLAAIIEQQRTAWSSGDYAVIGPATQIVAESICEAVDLRSGSRVLDVAAGNGNATLAAARRWCDVISTDFVGAWLENGRRRVEAEGYSTVTFQEADAENLPFPDSSFDVALSTFGVMFAPDQVKAANELLRVCRPGGKIGLANWTPTGFVGRMFELVAQYTPLPAGALSPVLWGTTHRLHELFGGRAAIEINPKRFVFRYRSPSHWLDVFRVYYGPMHRIFASLDVHKHAELSRELLALVEKCNFAVDQTLVCPSDYLEVVITKAA